MSEWISVKDRLPELPENPTILNCRVRVLVADRSDGFVGEASWVMPIHNRRKREPRWERNGQILRFAPTHWQPLPQPPKQESE